MTSSSPAATPSPMWRCTPTPMWPMRAASSSTATPRSSAGSAASPASQATFRSRKDRRVTAETRRVQTDRLEIAYEESGPGSGAPVILSHGFPDDPRTWDAVAPALAAKDRRVLAPYLRGYGPTRFLDPKTPRS